VTTDRPPRPRRPPRRRTNRRRLLVGIAILIVVFAVGVAFGAALQDNPSPGDSTTFVRTFLPVSPAHTVTVTTSGP